MPPKQQLSPKDQEKLMTTLQQRFTKHMHRHKGVDWTKVQAKLEKNAVALWSVHQMELTGGEPDVVSALGKAGECVFVDCSAESPKGRRSVCYDHPALIARKEHKPKDSALHMATEMGVELLTEEHYRQLQALEDVDTKTSSWIMTPPEIRKLGGALFCDRRYDHVFTYHNGADSYYAARGWRGMVRV